MKKCILIFALLISGAAFAQTDSSKAFVVASIKYQDAWYLMGQGILTPINPIMKTMYDSVEAKTRRTPTVDSTGNINIPAVQAQALLQISAALRDRRLMPSNLVFARIDAAIRAATGAVGRPWLIREMDKLNAADAEYLRTSISTGKKAALAVDQ